MARRRGGGDQTEMSPLLNDDDEAEWSTGSNEKLRFMVLGGDDALMDKACATILGERENRNAFKFGELMSREAQVCGRQVSVLKTPFYWLEHLKSYYIFSNGVKSLKYELQFFESLLFPGPHAFLLVHRDMKNSGREYYLLRALRDVFGEEVLDYCMVMFIDEAKHKDLKKNSCLKMCGGRYHILQNTDESVNQLFKKTETMTRMKSSNFFTNHLECFRKAENYFEAEYEKKENKLRRELAELRNELDALKGRENQKKEDFQKLKEELIIYKDRENKLRNELDALRSRENQMKEDFQKLKEELIIYKDRENKLRNELDALRSRENQMKEDFQKLKEELIIYKDRENKLRNELDALRSRENQKKEDFQKLKEELIIYKDRENKLRNELDALRSRENQMKEDFQKLKEELIIYKDGERQLKDNKEKLQREVEQLKDNEKQLQSNLTEAKGKEAFLLIKLQSECNMIQREEEVQVKEKELHEKERELDRRVKELYERQQNLDRRQKQLEIRERELTQRDGRSCDHHQTTADTHSSVSGEKNRPLDECEGELESREHSQAAESHGIHRPVRRNSKELEPPDMSESGPLHTL